LRTFFVYRSFLFLMILTRNNCSIPEHIILESGLPP